jgi:hypothetical protein
LKPSSNQVEKNPMADVNAVAYHEAGHAVVALALGSKVRVVEIGPQPHANCLHRGKKNKAIVALAGWLAEQRACPNSPWAADVDFEAACDSAEHLAPAAPLEALKSFLDQAAALLEAHWLEVEIVAAALLKRGKLTGAEIDALFCEG